MAQAAPVNLSTWLAEGTGSFNWVRDTDENGVVQTVNGSPTVFHSNVDSQGLALAGEITVQTSSDDDYIGFVLGFNSGDLTSATADYILIDWKQFDQTFYGGLGAQGLAISRVSGPLGDDSGAWWHDPTNNVTEIARAANLGSTGWDDLETYSFELGFTASRITVDVDGVREIDIAGTFANGSFGFYNYSQAKRALRRVAGDRASARCDPAAGLRAPAPGRRGRSRRLPPQARRLTAGGRGASGASRRAVRRP